MTLENPLLDLINNEIPEGRQNLQQNHSNLELVAKYCEDNYFRSENKRAALEETKSYTTQSLACVAYQINSLAYNLIHMLDLQSTQLAEMESQINHISQTVNIHQEKVTRREIGGLTVNKLITRQHKILVPANPEKQVKYTRKPIDYSILDDIGHGVRISSNTPRSKRISGQGQLNGANTMMSSSAAPTTKPPTPPQTIRGLGSLSRGSKEYRTLAPPVAPPQVPSNYAPNYPIGHPRAADSARRGSGYSTLPVSMAHASGHHLNTAMQHQKMAEQHYQTHQPNSQPNSAQPQVGMVHPLTHNAGLANSLVTNYAAPPSLTPPLPPPPPQDVSSSPANDSLPEPPMHLRQTSNNIVEKSGNASPPLPPPPPMGQMYNTERNFNNHDWIPKDYIEKVIAIYDYSANRDDELSFSENSLIYVIRKNEDGWYEGVMDGITGLFPGNYVEPCL